jgi:hypothetical protein
MLRLSRESAPYELPAIACEYSTRAVDRLSEGQPYYSDRRGDYLAEASTDIRREELARVLAKHGAVADDE